MIARYHHAALSLSLSVPSLSLSPLSSCPTSLVCLTLATAHEFTGASCFQTGVPDSMRLFQARPALLVMATFLAAGAVVVNELSGAVVFFWCLYWPMVEVWYSPGNTACSSEYHLPFALMLKTSKKAPALSRLRFASSCTKGCGVCTWRGATMINIIIQVHFEQQQAARSELPRRHSPATPGPPPHFRPNPKPDQTCGAHVLKSLQYLVHSRDPKTRNGVTENRYNHEEMGQLTET